MFLTLNHQKLEVYACSKAFVIACYKLTNFLPIDEKFGMISQIRRAALSGHLNMAEGSSKKSDAERKRYFEISRGSIVEIDAAINVAAELQYLQNINTEDFGIQMIKCFRLLTGLINRNQD